MTGVIEIAAGIVAVGGATGVIGAGALRLRRGVRQVEQFLSDWHGEQSRPGVDGRPGILARLGAVEDAVTRLGAAIEQTAPAVDRLTDHLATLDSEVHRIDGALVRHLDPRRGVPRQAGSSG